MSKLDKTVLALLIVLGACTFAYGYSEVVLAPIKEIVTVLNTAK